jgi:hypothetical protein
MRQYPRMWECRTTPITYIFGNRSSRKRVTKYRYFVVGLAVPSVSAYCQPLYQGIGSRGKSKAPSTVPAQTKARCLLESAMQSGPQDRDGVNRAPCEVHHKPPYHGWLPLYNLTANN